LTIILYFDFRGGGGSFRKDAKGYHCPAPGIRSGGALLYMSVGLAPCVPFCVFGESLLYFPQFALAQYI